MYIAIADKPVEDRCFFIYKLLAEGPAFGGILCSGASTTMLLNITIQTCTVPDHEMLEVCEAIFYGPRVPPSVLSMGILSLMG